MRTAGSVIVEGAKKTGQAIMNGVERITHKQEEQDTTVVHVKSVTRI